MFPLERGEAAERIGTVASILIFLTVYAACFVAFGLVMTLALAWPPAAVAAAVGGRATRSILRALDRAEPQAARRSKARC